jgi:hypothetical protein
MFYQKIIFCLFYLFYIQSSLITGIPVEHPPVEVMNDDQYGMFPLDLESYC